MREIKFRGCAIATGEWVYGYFKKNRCGDCYIEDEYGLATIVDPGSVGQMVSRGENGEEYYEGDILLDDWNEYYWVIEWDEDCHEFRRILYPENNLSEHSECLGIDEHIVGDIWSCTLEDILNLSKEDDEDEVHDD